ncbi:MAG TPA: hypothetical protein VKR59_18485 [Terriglobales bacterium]|nr:hypothetical protein [Terriglobales bacterium]
MRTLAVLLGAIVVSFATDAILQHYLIPNFGPLLVRMHTTPPQNSQWAEIWRQWHHANLISVFVLAPLGGAAGGIFVGLLQTHRAVLTAAISQIPNMFIVLWFDRHGVWIHSVRGVASAVGQHLLPVMAAMLGAAVFQSLLKLRRRADSATPASVASPA